MRLHICNALVLACIVIAFGVGGDAAAAPLLQGPPTAATGITGLQIDGAFYDVHFDNASITYNDLFAGGNPTFLNNEAGAIDATNAIDAVLNALGVTGIAGLVSNAPPGGEVVYFLQIPYAVFSFGNPVQSAAETWGPSFDSGHFTPWSRGGCSACSVDVPLLPNETWVTFGPGTTPPGTVPEPIPLALISSGLALMGAGAGRKRGFDRAARKHETCPDLADLHCGAGLRTSRR